MKRICYYVSGHGLGHASRATQVMQELGDDIELIIKSCAPAWFFEHELKRQYTLIPDEWDTGAHQRSNVEIDWDETFARAIEANRIAVSRLAGEAEFLKAEKFGLVVTDIPPAPLVAASRAGIPSVCIANFTWVEIFAAQAARHEEREELLTRYRKQYAHATLLIRPRFAFDLPYFPRVRNVPLIARRGTQLRQPLQQEYNIPPDHRLVLLYFGNWGEGDLPFAKLRAIEGITFVALNDMPDPIVKLDQAKFNFEDVAASVDAVVAKPGYGTMGECMANATPVVYYPRPEFSEYFRIREELSEWGGAVEMTNKDFLGCHWEPALERAFTLKPDHVDTSGASQAAHEIRKLLNL